ELEQFRHMIGQSLAAERYRIHYEGSAEISFLIEQFQNDEESVLCAVTLWEGRDIPGPSLMRVIVWELPFPPDDPVVIARRADSGNPLEDVDMPYMLLRLRQGIGRLIRSQEDSGTIAILSSVMLEQRVRNKVLAILPEGVGVESDLKI